MINLANEESRQRSLEESERMISSLEIGYADKVRAVLNRQFIDIAALVRQGSTDIEITDKQNQRFKDILLPHMRRTSDLFSKRVFNSFDNLKQDELTAEEQEYERRIELWFVGYSSSEILKRARTTKKILNKIIKKGLADGLSLNQVATLIIRQGRITNPARALRIARTETHTVAMRSKDQAAKIKSIFKRRKVMKQWVTQFVNSRDPHKNAHGEQVPLSESFLRTGESLQYPGDESGSPGNIINCNCDMVYITI